MCNAINISYSHRFLILTRIHFKLTLLTLWNYSLVLFDKNLHSKKAKIVFITIWNHKIVFWLGLQIFYFNQISVKVWDLSSSSGSIPIRGYWTCKSTNSHRRKFSKLVTYYDHVLILRNSIIITRGRLCTCSSQPTTLGTGRQGSASQQCRHWGTRTHTF